MGKEKTHINIVVIGHVDSGRDKENWKEGETVCGTRRICNIQVHMHTCPSCGMEHGYNTSFVAVIY